MKTFQNQQMVDPKNKEFLKLKQKTNSTLKALEQLYLKEKFHKIIVEGGQTAIENLRVLLRKNSEE
jgi:hypothetical protein